MAITSCELVLVSPLLPRPQTSPGSNGVSQLLGESAASRPLGLALLFHHPHTVHDIGLSPLEGFTQMEDLLRRKIPTLRGVV